MASLPSLDSRPWPGHAGRASQATCVLREYAWRDFESAERQIAWEALAQWAAEPNPFFESWYLLPSLGALDPAGEVRLLCLEVDGQLAGLLPVRREQSYYGHRLPHWRNWVHANCFLGLPLVARGLEEAFWREVLAWCDRRGGAPLFLHLSEVPEAGPVMAALARAPESDPRPAAIVEQQERALLQSPLSPEAYLEQSLSGKKRKELRRQQRRLAELGALDFELREDAQGLAEWTDAFIHLEASGWKGDAGSAIGSDAGTTELFTHSLREAARRGRLQRLTLSLDGRPIALLANFIAAPGAFSYKTAFDESFARFSPGVLLQLENLRLLERPDIEWCDSCAAADHPMIEHLWREKRTIRKLSIGIGGKVRRSLFTLLAAYETGCLPGGLT